MAMDLAAEEQKLLAAVIALYDRFRSGVLRDGDVIEPGLEGKSDRRWMAHAIADKSDLQPDACVFGHFRREHGTILDIGAHWGYTALAMRLSGTDCPIISIEASSMHEECLDELRSWDIGYDFVIQPLGSSSQERSLYTPVVNGFPITGLTNVDGDIFDDHHARHLASIIGTYIPAAPGYRVQLACQPVSLRPLDEVLATGQFRISTSSIAAIKLDVENHEIQVLNGAMKTLAEHRPFLMIEGGNRHSGVVNLLHELGYLYAERQDDVVRLHSGFSQAVNGYWIHESRLDFCSRVGLLAN
jgi:FkbM family methyltransferase